MNFSYRQLQSEIKHYRTQGFNTCKLTSNYDTLEKQYKRIRDIKGRVKRFQSMISGTTGDKRQAIIDGYFGTIKNMYLENKFNTNEYLQLITMVALHSIDKISTNV